MGSSATESMVALFFGFAFIQNINNFVLSAVTRLRARTISNGLNLLIAVLSSAATLVAVILASILKSQALRLGFDAFVDLAARGALVIMGGWMMWNYIRKWLKYRPEPAEFIREQTQGHEWKIIGAGKKLGFYESVILGLIMASDNLGISSFFGLINPLHRYYAFSGLFLALLTGIFSFLAVGLGQLSGDETRRRFLQMPQAVFFLELMGSALIILLGLYDPAGVIVEAAIPH